MLVHGSMHALRTTIAPGTMLAGKYRVEGTIGEGGMGVVVAAIHLALNQRVAIKLLRTSHLSHGEALGRFIREARAAARLRSQHITKVLDVGTLEDGLPYMVMEHLEGRDLGELLKAGPLQVPLAVDYVMQTCEAVAEAHAAGIVHRDLKPSNLFLTHAADGRAVVKVLDFGISKMADNEDLRLTGTKEIIGSPTYMSPEQLRSSRDVDARADIWSLGVILFELLTCDIPFRAGNITELIAAVLADPVPSIRERRPDVPEELDGIVRRCLGKKPDERFATVLDFVTALEPFGNVVTMGYSDRVRSVAASSGQLPHVPNTGPVIVPSTGPHLPLPETVSAGHYSHQTTQLQPTPPAQGSGPSPMIPPMVTPRHANPAQTGMQWGTTGSRQSALPATKDNGSSRVALAIVAAGVLLAGAGVVGAGVYWKVRSAAPPPTTVTVDLPQGRKDLPIATASAPPPTPVEPTTVAPPPSALPDQRNLPAIASARTIAPAGHGPAGPKVVTSAKAAASASAPPPTPTPPTTPTSTDPLNGIGRR